MDFELNGGRVDSNPAPFVIFATPTLNHQVSLDFHRSYIDTSALLSAQGIQHGCIQVPGVQFIARARNELVSRFLEIDGATDLFFIDDDIGWPPEAALRLLSYQQEVVAGLPPEKSDGNKFPGRIDFTDEQFHLDGPLFRALLLPLGFVRIKRSVLAHMAAKSQPYPNHQPDGSTLTDFDIFHMGMGVDGEWWGEDYAFCNRWRELGGTLWLDPDITFKHAGRKTWTGSVAGVLAATIAGIQAQAAEHIAPEVATEPEKESV